MYHLSIDWQLGTRNPGVREIPDLLVGALGPHQKTMVVLKVRIREIDQSLPRARDGHEGP